MKMIAITKPEKEIIAQQFPHVHIVRTMKQKSKRHHYYCEEHPRVMSLLQQLRAPAGNTEVDTDHGIGTKKR